MSNFKQVFNDRISMLNKNPQALVDIISDLDSNLNIVYNDDRTIFINGNSNIEIINNAIKRWAGDLQSPIHMIYDIFPLTKDSYLLKI